MRKLLFPITLFVLFVVVLSSCSNTKTYAEKLADEKNAIAKLIADSFVVIPYNADSLYTKSNRHIMLLDSKGLYIAIISKGDVTKKAVKNATVVNYRFKGMHELGADTTYQTETKIYPLNFTYGQSSTYFDITSDLPYSYACEGLQRPLVDLGDGAIVKLIIPSKLSFISHQSNVVPIYFQELKYTFSLH